jgi:3-methyladenine DNA glycosylase AlkC
MSFYDLPKQERTQLAETISTDLLAELQRGKLKKIISYFSDKDTYIRKSVYLSIGRIYLNHNSLHAKIIVSLQLLIAETDFKIRQTAINSAGEIGIWTSPLSNISLTVDFWIYITPLEMP